MLTLVVIGVVAILTIPVAFHGYTKMTENIAKEKFVSDFNSSLENYSNDTYLENTSSYGYSHIKPYLNFSKECGGDNDCIPRGGYKFIDESDSTVQKYFNRTGLLQSDINILSNGNILISRSMYRNHCDTDNCTEFYFYVDINGQRLPNEFGRELLCFEKLNKNNYITPCSYVRI